jgi:4-hydroxy-4-methyl-2-oxoglutarate aldolase
LSDPALPISVRRVTTLSDALDRLGIAGQCIGIMPYARGIAFAGPAVTIRMGLVGARGSSIGAYIDDVAPGQIVAIDNDGRLEATARGEIPALVAHRRGVGGTMFVHWNVR